MGTNDKLSQLRRLLVEMGNIAVAYSGGVDSTFLLKAAADCLPEGKLVALTAVSPSLPESELNEAKEIANQLGVNHVLIDSHEIEDPNYLQNSPDRCFFCKSEVYDLFVEYIQEQDYHFIVDGTNADDVGDHRPGRRAAKLRGVRSPLQEVGFNKAEIREFAREMGLPNWDKPAAACLSSRIPYGTRIDVAALAQVERAEEILKRLGLGQLRVRHHGDIARLELEPDEFERALVLREQVNMELKALGYRYVTLDLGGFRSGSMNEALKESHGYRETLPVIQ